MKRLITLMALGAAIGFGARAQEPATPPAPPADAKPSAAQIEQINKQLEGMRKQLDATQAQLKALQGSGAPVASPAPAPPVPPAAPTTSHDSVNRFGGSYTVGENEEVNGDARVVGGSLTVNGKVNGDATAFGGSLVIDGEVDGDAVVTGGSMSLGPHAVVRGDVTVTGGSLQRDPGSVIDGDVKVTGGSQNNAGSGDYDINLGGRASESAFMKGPFPFPLALTVLLAGVFLLVACPKRLDTIGRAFVNQPAYSLVVGILAVPLAIVLAIVTTITIVGPVIVTFGTIGAFFMGLTAVAVMLGRRIALGRSYRSRFFPLIVGLGVWLLASATSRVIPPALVLMSIATGVTYLMAFGAALGTGFGKNPNWLKNRMEGNRDDTPWMDPNYTYAGNDK